MWLKKKRVSLVEKNVWITERFFDNHYRSNLYFILEATMHTGENDAYQ